MRIENLRSEVKTISSRQGRMGTVYYNPSDGYVMRTESLYFDGKIRSCCYIRLVTGVIIFDYTADLEEINCKLVID